MSKHDAMNWNFTGGYVIPDYFCNTVAYTGINDEDFVRTESLLFDSL
jgi:hypothetical protein